MLTIANRSREIVSTNFWTSDRANAGMALLSWNVGAARLLVPPSLEHDLPDMVATKQVIVTFVKWRERHDRDVYEILFEGGSDEPYCLFLVAEQLDRKLPKSADGIQLTFIIWTAGGRQCKHAGYYLPRIPCLQAMPPNTLKVPAEPAPYDSTQDEAGSRLIPEMDQN